MNTALVIMDMQPDFEEPGQIVEVLENIRGYIEGAKQGGWDIVVIEYSSEYVDSSTYKSLIRAIGDYPYITHTKDTDSGADIITDLLPSTTNIVLVGCNICGCLESTLRGLHEQRSPQHVTVPLQACFCGAWFYSLHQCNTIDCRIRVRKAWNKWPLVHCV